MLDSKLGSKIHSLQGRIAELQQNISGAELQAEVLAEALEGLSTGVEELANTLEEEPDILQVIMENTHAHLAYLDPQFNFVRANSAYVHGSGHSEEELIGHNHFDLFPNLENQAIFERVRDTGQAVEFHAKPFEYADQPERGTTYWDWTLVPVKDTMGNVQGLVFSLLEVTERKRAEDTLRKRTHELGERVKELNCLYGISALVEKPGISLAEILQGTVGLMPPAWQYPEITGARIALEGHEFRTKHFRETATWQQAADIILHGQRSGTVEVCYLEERPESDEGPFLKEERSLINAIAERLGKIIERVRAEALLREQNQFIVSVFESLRHPFFVIDANDYTVKMANSAAHSGELPESVTCYALTHRRTTPCVDAGHLCPVEEIKKTGKPVVAEHIHYDREGHRKVFEVHGHAIFDDEGKVAQIIEYTLDVTQRKRAEEALQERTQELSTLLEISRHVALTLELEPLLDLILDHLKAVVDYDGATISRLEGEVLTGLAHRGPIPQENVSQLRFSLENTLIGRQVILDQKPVIIPDVRGESPLARDFREVVGQRFQTIYGQVSSWMGVPLTIKDRVMGILALQHNEPDHYRPRQADLVLAFANQAAVAIENARLYEQAQVLAAMQERQRLARDLHDAVSQALFSASLSAEVLPQLWERNRIEGQRCLEEIHHLTRGALAEMRTLLLELRPEALVETGLSDLLGQLTEAIGRRARLPVTVTVEQLGPVPPDVQVAVYRISQEALNNVAKHAEASRAVVCLRPVAEEEQRRGLELLISDDGHGFDAECVPPDSLGLGIMHERAEAIGAELRIESQIGQGTQVVVVWPGV